MPRIQVADVAASVECALDLGGSELMPGKDEDGKSHWAVLLDPNGAAFGIIPVVSTIGDDRMGPWRGPVFSLVLDGSGKESTGSDSGKVELVLTQNV